MILAIILTPILAVGALCFIHHVVRSAWRVIKRPYFLGDCAFWGVMAGAACLGAWLQP